MEKEIKELQDKLDALKLKYEQSKQHFKGGDVVECGSAIIKITDFIKEEGYGLNRNGKWEIASNWSFKTRPEEWQLSTPEKWLEVCKNEAVKRGIGFDKKINCSSIHKIKVNDYTLNGGEFKYIENSLVWQEYNKESYFPIMRNGIWAEVMKDKTLGSLYEDWVDSDFECCHDFIKANPEAYIKAIQNLKK